MLAWSCSTCSANQNSKHKQIAHRDPKYYMHRAYAVFAGAHILSSTCHHLVCWCFFSTILSSCRVSPTCGALTLSAWSFFHSVSHRRRRRPRRLVSVCVICIENPLYGDEDVCKIIDCMDSDHIDRRWRWQAAPPLRHRIHVMNVFTLNLWCRAFVDPFVNKWWETTCKVSILWDNTKWSVCHCGLGHHTPDEGKCHLSSCRQKATKRRRNKLRENLFLKCGWH